MIDGFAWMHRLRLFLVIWTASSPESTWKRRPKWCTLSAMNPLSIPVDSELQPAESATAYDAWFRAKVTTALRDARPGAPHAQAIAALRARLVGEDDHIKVRPEA
jgi:hypothetical protein